MENQFSAAARTLGGYFLFVVTLVLSSALLFGALARPGLCLPAATEQEKTVTVVIDAGHGGEDGGAVGVTGVLEKTLNLEIATAVGELLSEAGVRVVYTRTEDRLLYTEEQNIRGQRKLWDLKNRLAVAAGEENPLLLSIHMNKYPSESATGMQVYFAPGAESRKMAVAIAGKVCADFPDMKRRVPKAAGDSIYLLAHASCPAVLVECGFLSNAGECQKLSDKDYQRRLSFSIFCAMMEYIEQMQ